jgi:hypothetical protein
MRPTISALQRCNGEILLKSREYLRKRGLIARVTYGFEGEGDSDSVLSLSE